MKLICTQSDLNTNLSLVSRAVPSRPTHPVLANVLLQADADKQQVSLTAFDLSLGIRSTMSAQVEASGTITLPAKLLTDIVSRLPAGEITLEAGDEDEGGIVATLTSSFGRYQVRGMGDEEFPELPVIENGEAISLQPEALIEGLRSTLFSTSADETKQVLTGVHFTVSQDSLEFAATDGHRLAVVETTQEDTEENGKPKSSQKTEKVEITVPARALRELERMLGMKSFTEAYQVHFEQGQIVFEGGEHRLTSRTLEGQYPAYRQLIPRSFALQMTVERRSLLSAVERIAVLADQKNNIVKFTIDSEDQQLYLSVEAKDVGNGKESMSAEISGESLEIAFNIKYLTDGLKALSTSQIQMQLNNANSPVILNPLGGLKMTYLIMPVQLTR